MKKILTVCLLVSVIFIFTQKANGWDFSVVRYAFTTDVIEMLDEEYYQGEFMKVLNRSSAWAVRVGYYSKMEDSELGYGGDTKHWELGFRWRYFLLEERAPNLIFVGMGFDNRPQDNSITPTGEAGINVCFKPVILSVIGFYGYQLHWKSESANRWVKGLEARVGVCF